MAFIRYDQPEVWQRREQGAARPDDHTQQTGTSPPPGIVALALRQLRMDKSHRPGETTQEPMDRLRREGDLRDQDNRLLPASDGFLRRAQINLRFARAGHALEEKRGKDVG